jgi:zinc protease
MTALLLAVVFLAQDLPKGDLPNTSLPTGEAVIAKYVQATGGQAAYDKVHNTLATGKMSMPAQGITGKVTMYEAEPAKNYTAVDIPGIGLVEDGTDGTVAWEKSALQGARLKSGDERAFAIRSANSHRKFTNLKKFYRSVETIDIETIDGKPCYKVVETPIEGKPETSYYEKESGLLIKETGTMASPMGEIPFETEIGDYRKVGDLMIPHKMMQSFVGQRMLILLDSIKINTEIPKDRFSLPAEVKALMK